MIYAVQLAAEVPEQVAEKRRDGRADAANQQKREITIENLLTMQSGLASTSNRG